MRSPHGYVEYDDGKGRPRTCEEAEAAREADRRDAERYREIVRCHHAHCSEPAPLPHFHRNCTECQAAKYRAWMANRGLGK